MTDTAIPVTVGLAIGIAFIILFAAFMPSAALTVGGISQTESDMSASAYYFLYDCVLPHGGLTPAESDLVKDRNWISVAKIDSAMGVRNGIDAPCTIVTPDLASKIPALTTAMKGADGCADGTEICQVSYGISRGGDEADYELTVTKEEAADILKEIRFEEYNAAMLAKGDSFYMMWFHSIEEGTSTGAQIETRFLEPFPSTPVSLVPGQSVNYTLAVKTWATYGGPARIDLSASSSARDSGLLVELEPSSLEIPERSEARAILKITATEGARDGTYDINVGGRINDNGYIPEGPCSYGQCKVRVGNSSWQIQTFGIGTYVGQYGPHKVPDWLRLDVETDKQVYATGEPVEIKAYLVNDGTENLTVDRSAARLMMSVARAYIIDAFDFASADSIIVEPKSKVLLVRPFIWDQKTFRSGEEPFLVQGGQYNIAVSFSGVENYVLHNSTQISIDKEQTIQQEDFAGTTIVIPAGVNENDSGAPFEPDTVTVPAGTSLRWENQDFVIHTATSSTPSSGPDEAFDTGFITQGEHSAAIVLEEPGDYPYYCVLHPWMTGKATVE